MRLPGVQNARGTQTGARRRIPPPASIARSMLDSVDVTPSYGPALLIWNPFLRHRCRPWRNGIVAELGTSEVRIWRLLVHRGCSINILFGGKNPSWSRRDHSLSTIKYFGDCL